MRHVETSSYEFTASITQEGDAHLIICGLYSLISTSGA